MNADTGVTGLRGWASLLVVGYHIGIALAVPSSLWLFLGWGYTGVDLFFVVSGYVLTRKVWDGDYGGTDGGFLPTVYYLRRAFRIWPLYWLALPLFIVLMSYPATPLDAVFAQNYLPSTFAYAPPWTLCIEELFYLVVPLWAIAYKSRWWPHLTVALLLGSLAWRAYATLPGTDLYLMAQFPSYAFSYGIGAAAARGVRLPTTIPRWFKAALLVVSLPLLVLWQNTLVQPALAAGGAFVILTEFRSSTLFVHPTVQFLGRLTYPVYLFGLPVERGLQDLTSDPWIWAVGTVAVTISLAWIVSRAFERPIIAWSRQLEHGATDAPLVSRARPNGWA